MDDHMVEVKLAFPGGAPFEIGLELGEQEKRFPIGFSEGETVEGEVKGEGLERDALQLDIETCGLGDAGTEELGGQPRQHQTGDEGVENQNDKACQGEGKPPAGQGTGGLGGGVGHG